MTRLEKSPALAAVAGLTRLEDYRSPEFQIESIELVFDLDAVRTVVSSRLKILRASEALHEKMLRLDGQGLELLALALEGTPLSPDQYAHDDEGLTLFDVPDAFVLETRHAVAPAQNKSGNGLFDLNGKLATQCEAEGFRRITFFPDRPDILTRYRVTLVADIVRYPVLLSNGEPIDSGELEDGRHWVTWEDRVPKPCYIFALVAGNFAVLKGEHITPSGRHIAVNIYADHADLDRCGFAMRALKRSLEWDEATFGLEYDLPLFNVVALTGWVGAMENKGLNLHEAHGVVADTSTSTDDDFVIIERILGHEQFHNWTGNRVTCRDWFQLSLKEGLTRLRDQMFIADKMGAGAWRIENVKTLWRNQFPEDDGPAAHPVKPTSYAEIRNFYTTTIYDKGAEIVRMMMTLLGWDMFRRGFDLYIARHDGEAVTTEEFVRAMEDASGRDFGQFRRWYAQAGRPSLTVDGTYDAESRAYSLTVRQNCRTVGDASPPEPFHIPIAVALISADGAPVRFRYKDAAGGEAVGEEIVLELTEAEQSFRFEDVPSSPTPSLLRGFSAPVSITANLAPEALALLMAHDQDPFARWDASQKLGVQIIRDASSIGAPQELPEHFIAAFEQTLRDKRISDLLKSQILSIPDQPVLGEGLASIDLDGLMRARDGMRRQLAMRFEAELWDIYRERAGRLSDDPSFESISARRLQNCCLELLMASGDEAGADQCLVQLRSASNMTDQFEALAYLVHREGPQREEAIAYFYERWSSHPLVINKWFQAQALDRGPNGAAHVLALSRHPDLMADDLPRHVAFYGAFFRNNRVSFHDPNGTGYSFLADKLLEIDVAGRAASRFFMPQINQWRRYDPVRQELMRAQLERMIDTAGISKGLRESVSLALLPA